MTTNVETNQVNKSIETSKTALIDTTQNNNESKIYEISQNKCLFVDKHKKLLIWLLTVVLIIAVVILIVYLVSLRNNDSTDAPQNESEFLNTTLIPTNIPSLVPTLVPTISPIVNITTSTTNVISTTMSPIDNTTTTSVPQPTVADSEPFFQRMMDEFNKLENYQKALIICGVIIVVLAACLCCIIRCCCRGSNDEERDNLRKDTRSSAGLSHLVDQV